MIRVEYKIFDDQGIIINYGGIMINTHKTNIGNKLGDALSHSLKEFEGEGDLGCLMLLPHGNAKLFTDSFAEINGLIEIAPNIWENKLGKFRLTRHGFKKIEE